MVKDMEKIKKDAEEIVSRFSQILEEFNLSEVEEELYILDVKNVLREDEVKIQDSSFRENALKIAPKVKDGYIVVEKGKWTN